MFKALLVSAAFACTRAQMTPQGDCEPGYVQCSGWWVDLTSTAVP